MIDDRETQLQLVEAVDDEGARREPSQFQQAIVDAFFAGEIEIGLDEVVVPNWLGLMIRDGRGQA